MDQAIAFPRENSHPALRAIVPAGLICGVLDINGAFLTAWYSADVPPDLLLKIVASGLLGAAARDGDWTIAALGLFMHFCVAFTVTTIFYALSRRIKFLTRQAVVSGLLYGAGVYVTMNLVVLPLLAQFRSLYIPDTKPFVPHLTLGQFCVHLTCVGLAVSLSIKRWSR